MASEFSLTVWCTLRTRKQALGPPLAQMPRLCKLGKGAQPGADELCACVHSLVKRQCLCGHLKKGLLPSRPTSPSARQRKGWILAPLNPLAWCPCAMNNRYNSTWWLAKHYLSLSISTSCYKSRKSVAEFLGLLAVTLPTPKFLLLSSLWTVPGLPWGCRGGIYRNKRKPPVSLTVPDFLWFWHILASPVTVTCHIQGWLWQKSAPSWRWLGSFQLCGYWKLSN